LEGSLAADSELAEPVAQRMHQLGERKDVLADAEPDEYLALVSFWKSQTLAKAEAAVALQRRREAIADLVTAP